MGKAARRDRVGFGAGLVECCGSGRGRFPRSSVITHGVSTVIVP